MKPIADPAAQVALWKRARAMCARAIYAIGEPAAIAAKPALSRASKRDIACWLARLESIVRKLLFALGTALLQEEHERASQDKSPRLEPVWTRRPPARRRAKRRENRWRAHQLANASGI